MMDIARCHWCVLFVEELQVRYDARWVFGRD
jgi:hypothetical protein